MIDPTTDAVEAFCKQLDSADMDVLRELVQVFVERLMSEQVDQICGAPFGQRSEARVNKRNGYRPRPVDTRVGTIDVQIPKLREGSHFPRGWWSLAGGPRGCWWRSWLGDDDLVDEGETTTYSFTTSDVDSSSFSLDAVSCGAGGIQVGSTTFDSSTGAGSFDCSFPDGPPRPRSR